jgi:hypothetical protein
MLTKVVIACKNSSGNPHIFACQISSTYEEYKAGEHTALALHMAFGGNPDSHFPFIVYEDSDEEFMRFFADAFDWDNVPQYTV